MTQPNLKLRFNPFRPGSLVSPGIFAGRIEELELFETMLRQTKNGNPLHFSIRGERGIGKSSLLLILHYLATGDISSLNDQKFRFLNVPIELDLNTTYIDIIKKVGSELRRAVAGHERVKEQAKQVWDFLKRWEIMGVRYDNAGPGETHPHELLEELVATFASVSESLSKEFEGILVTIDEADKPTPAANLGEFTKLFTERLTKRGAHRVALGLAGLPHLTKRLKDSHESAPRVFHDMMIDPLTPEERKQVVTLGMDEAERVNGYRTEITDEAKEWIATYSEGYPNFVQQFAFCAFASDTDNVIDEGDVVNGSHGENGAFHQLGVRYFHDLYFDQIGSDEYRKVLRSMADDLDGWVTKEQLRTRTRLKETTLSNALTALRKRHIIIAKEGKQGVYRLPTKSFAVWIMGYTSELDGAPGLFSDPDQQTD